MGGALDVRGNIDPSLEAGQDGSAVVERLLRSAGGARIFQTAIPITLCPLDLTNRVPIASRFVRSLCQRRRHPLCDLAASCYALVMHQDSLRLGCPDDRLSGRRDLFTTQDRQVGSSPRGYRRAHPAVQSAARARVQVLSDVDLAGFYEYLFASLTRV